MSYYILKCYAVGRNVFFWRNQRIMAICNFLVNDAIVLEKYLISTHLTNIVVALAYLKKKSM